MEAHDIAHPWEEPGRGNRPHAPTGPASGPTSAAAVTGLLAGQAPTSAAAVTGLLAGQAPTSTAAVTGPLAAAGSGAGPTAVKDAVAAAVAGLLGAPPALVLFFPHASVEPETALAHAAAAAPGSRLAGMSSDGLIAVDGVQAGGCAAMAFGPELRVAVGVAPHASRELRAAGRLAAERALDDLEPGSAYAALLLFVDPLSGDAADAIDGAYAAAGAGLPLAGGGANGRDPRLFADDVAVADAVVAVALGSPAPIAVGIADGCRPRGLPAIATRTDGRVLLEFNGRPAEEVYLENLGCPVGLDDAAFEALAVLHPLAQPEMRGRLRLRHIIGRAPGGGLACATAIPPNAAVLFTEQTPRTIVDSTGRAVEEALDGLDGAPRAVLVFDCAARKRALGSEIAAEVRALMRALGDVPAVTGLYTRGEVGRCRGAKGDRNHAVVVVALG